MQRIASHMHTHNIFFNINVLKFYIEMPSHTVANLVRSEQDLLSLVEHESDSIKELSENELINSSVSREI